MEDGPAERGSVLFRTVIVPLNGSAAAEAAIPYAIDQASHHGATLVLVRVIARPELPVALPRLGGPMPHMPIWPADELATDDMKARAYLDGVRRRFRLPVGSEVVITVGDPYQRLVAEIQQRPEPMVVAAAAGGARPAHPEPDGMANRILRAGIAPILVVREGVSVPAGESAASEAASTHGTMSSSRSPRLAPSPPAVGAVVALRASER